VRRVRAAEEAVRPCAGCARGVGGLECAEETRQGLREGGPIHDMRVGRGVAGEPTVDGPRVGEGLVRLTRPDDLGDGQRDGARDDREPRLLLRHGGRIPRSTRQADGEVIAEAEGAVVVPAGDHLPHRQVGPARELARDQPAHECVVDRSLSRHRQ